MTLTVLSKKRIFRNYLVYDMEWIPGTLEIRLIGVYDGNRYRYYTTIEQFVANELTNKNRGKWFYAHAGGLADFQFLLEHMSTRTEFRLEASFSGSSAIIVKVHRGKHTFHFIDSYWLLREKLRSIGKWIGIHKGNEDESVEFYRDAPIAVLRDYNEIDCRILYNAIEAFEETIMDLGGQLMKTQAGCALDLFRRRFLKADIETGEAVNKIARHAYFASRVEVITTHCQDALYYDVNSSFPYAMTYDVPGELIGTFRKLPDPGGKQPFLADVMVDVPESYFPPLPTRHSGRLFFPTGRWRGWYSNIDIELLYKVGGKVRSVYEVMKFHPRDDLKDYANTLFDLRKKADGFVKVAYKYLLNSLYGKFGETDVKSKMVINPRKRPPITDMVSPGIFISDHIVPVPHMHVPISVHITAIARRTLYDFMSMSSELHYCDTDGFSTTDRFVDGNGLGEIKLEKIISEGRFVAAKVYRLEGWKPDKEGNPGEEIGVDEGVKAKGFSRMTLEKFQALTRNVRIDGSSNLADPKFLDGKTLAEIEEIRRDDEVEYTRMRRIKEIVRSDGPPKPREDTIRKGLRQSISKRFFYPDGHSRPWNIEELNHMFGDEKK